MKVLVDAFLIIHRAKYKLDFLQNEAGRKTGMEYGFLKLCEALQREFEDANIVLCWEGKNNFRKVIYPDYKGNRPPSSVKLEWNRVEELKNFLKHPFINAEAEGFEADDVIASLVDHYKVKEEVIIWSNDKDMLQLIRKGITVYKSFQELNKKYKWTPETVELKYYGLFPVELPIFFAFAGDKSDNIPGVPRIRKPVLASAIINARRSIKSGSFVFEGNLISDILSYELWSGVELQRIESFIKAGYLQRNIELVILRRPDVIIEEPTNDKEAIKKWLTELELKSLKMSEAVGMNLDDEEF